MKVTDLIPWNRNQREAARGRGDNGSGLLATRDLDRALESFWQALEHPLTTGWDQAFSGGFPRIDLHEDEKSLEIVAELPGMEKRDVDISITEGFLTIRGEKKLDRKEEDEGYVLRERTFGRLERVVPLPDGLDVDSAKAKFKNGVLRITIPKAEQRNEEVKRVHVSRG
jgi:HSP20 family protein